MNTEDICESCNSERRCLKLGRCINHHGSGAAPCSTHVLLKVRSPISGFCFTEPVAAFTTRKRANAEARRKNDAATTCEYVVKTLKVIR